MKTGAVNTSMWNRSSKFIEPPPDLAGGLLYRKVAAVNDVPAQHQLEVIT
jgi:hypothetical protein